MYGYMNNHAKQRPLGKQKAYSRGVAIVEFAIVLPLLVVLLFGFTEFGRMLYQQNQLTKQMALGLRYMARAPDAVTYIPGTEESQPECRKNNPMWDDAIDRASALIKRGNTSGDILENLSVTINDEPEVRSVSSSGGHACIISASATAQFNAVFGNSMIPIWKISPVILNASGEERYVGL